MNSNLKRLPAVFPVLAVVISGVILFSFSVPLAKAKQKGPPAVSYAFNDSPEHQAIVKLLQSQGKVQMLRDTYSVATEKGKDFTDAIVRYYEKGEPAKSEFFLFNEDGVWKAYSELPTKQDRFAVFAVLARQYCHTLYKNHMATSLPGDTWKSDNPKKRPVNVVCREVVDNKWQDHPLTFVYEFDDNRGWHITGKQETKPPAKSPPQVARPMTGQKAVWGKAKDAVAQIIESIGGNPQPVFIMFGTAGHDFIQFHYVSESDDKDIYTVDWNNGKISEPRASRLARPCPKIPLGDIDFNLVSKIFADMNGKAMKGDMINVNLSRRFANGCQEPIWQGIATSGKHSLTVTYSLDGKQINKEEYKF